MNFKYLPHLELEKSLLNQALFTAWVGAGLPPELASGSVQKRLPVSASSEVQRCLYADAAPARVRPAPFFVATDQEGAGSTWSACMLADLNDRSERDKFQENLGLLQSGQAEVIITGQQPGAMGGPLYTLYKIATTVALARLRTQGGLPSVPVFWSGDDDDDLVEAMLPRTLEPLSQSIFGNTTSLAGYTDGSRQRPCVGNLSVSRWSSQASQWLNNDALRARLPVLGLDLADMWATACAEEWSWSGLNRRFLLRVFQGTGLMIVSGNDPFLHDAAAPFYQEIKPRRAALSRLVRQQGSVLGDMGFSLPINDRSVHRHLFETHGQGRRFLEADQTLPEPGQLRPGVMLRSPVQDWLFEPAAVVVGPGELSYLRQLDPLYNELGLTRCPLVPRLFGWIVPEGFDQSQLRVSATAASEDIKSVAGLAEQAALAAELDVKRILIENLGTEAARASKLASGRARRWRRSLESMFKAEADRMKTATGPSDPVWVFPEGSRQERVLSSLSVATLWGAPLIEAMISGAAQHLQLGLVGNWQEFVTEVPDPTGDWT